MSRAPVPQRRRGTTRGGSEDEWFVEDLPGPFGTTRESDEVEWFADDVDLLDVRRRWPEDRVGEVAERQRTLITREQALACGATPRSLRCAVARTRLYAVHRGVFSTAPPSLRPPLWREQAALLASGPGAVLSHRTAAILHGLLPGQAAGAVETWEQLIDEPELVLHWIVSALARAA